MVYSTYLEQQRVHHPKFPDKGVIHEFLICELKGSPANFLLQAEMRSLLAYFLILLFFLFNGLDDNGLAILIFV